MLYAWNIYAQFYEKKENMLEIYMHNFTKKRKHALNIYAHTFLRKKRKHAWDMHIFAKNKTCLKSALFFATKSVNLWFVQVIVVENSTDEEDEETKALNPLPIVWNQRRDKNGFKISYILVCKIKT